MEKRKDEDPDCTPLDSTTSAAAPEADPAGALSATAEPADIHTEEKSADGEDPENGETLQGDGAADPDPAQPPAESGTSDPDTSGTGPGSDGGPDGEPDGESGAAETPGGGEDPSGNPDPASGEGSQFGERFLNSGASAAAGNGPRRESLAASLLRAALALLTGELPPDTFIPLMEAALAREAIVKARTEGEIAGRNAVIEERLVTPATGAPDLNGTPVARSRRPAASIFDLAEMAR